ncbi:hypothetical protein LCGC14_2926310 [marine sediment metagenome]|uniref:Uncharacterized protein n=1 Tax=marine sediment metagenome TaxID=412755 RepID=A0A0F8XMC6_9ZZZZ
MVALQPAPFTTASPALVNFDSQEIANGTAYEDYFLIESEDSGGKDYHLTPNPDFSNSATISLNQATFDQDFDLTPFVLPRTINGTVLISIPISNQAAATSTTTVELYKWDGSSETQLGSTVFVAKALSAAAMVYIRMPIVNKLIPAGEQLRVRVIYANPSNTTALMGIDPANRADGTLTITTQSKISIPYDPQN